jgi:hypothetical protein
MLAKITMFLLFLLLGTQSGTTKSQTLPDSSGCPKVDINVTDESAKEPILFTAEVEETDRTNAVADSSMNKLVYSWAITEGTIISGEYTKYMKIDRKGLRGKTIYTTVEVSGFINGCVVTEDRKHLVKY